jgi:hypothetical protein
MTRGERNEVLQALAKANNGKLTPELLIETAQDPNHPLHELFPWDDEQAAHRYRLAVARAMIRGIRIEVRTEKHNFTEVPVYVHDPAESGQSYISLQEASREDKREVLLSELERVTQSLERAQKISAQVMPTIIEELETLLNSVLAIKGKVKRQRK